MKSEGYIAVTHQLKGYTGNDISKKISSEFKELSEVGVFDYDTTSKNTGNSMTVIVFKKQ